MNQFYLRDSRSNVGSFLTFWGGGGNGYTSNLAKAHRYSREEAYRQHELRGSDIPVPADYVDSHAQLMVDVQLLRGEHASSAGVTLYHLQRLGMYDGNAAYWLTATGTYSPDFGQAIAVSMDEAIDLCTQHASLKIWEKPFIDTIAVSAVTAASVLDKRNLRQAGITLPTPPKEKAYTQRYRCAGCNRFMKAVDYYGVCPNCNTDNRP